MAYIERIIQGLLDREMKDFLFNKLWYSMMQTEQIVIYDKNDFNSNDCNDQSKIFINFEPNYACEIELQIAYWKIVCLKDMARC